MTARYAVVARLIAPFGTGGPDPDPETVVDLIWARAAAADRLDHVRVRAGPDPGDVDVLAFLRAETEAEALDRARQLFIRITRASLLNGWELPYLRTTALSELLPNTRPPKP